MFDIDNRTPSHVLLNFISLRNVNGLMDLPLVAREDFEDNNDNNYFFSPLGGTSEVISDEQQHEKAIMDDVSLLLLPEYYFAINEIVGLSYFV